MADSKPPHSPPPSSDEPGAAPVRVWDAPTRLFHWALVVLAVFNVVSGKVGGNTLMDYHMLGGYAILALVAFRVLWGFVGGRHARFASFVRGPGAVIGYFRSFNRGARWVGHNPAGGWSVLLMLALLAAQGATGLFANDDILVEGPLMKYVTKATSNYLTYIHNLVSTALMVIVAVHVLAVLVYLAKGENLIAAMITGRKAGIVDESTHVPVAVAWWRAVVVAAIAGGAVWAVINLL